MQTNTLGTSDLTVTKICLGTMTRGQQNTEQEAHDQLDYAIDQGINFIDTAEVYAIPPTPETQGLTEIYIGNRLTKTGKRNDLIIATKVTGKGMPHIRNGEGFTPQGIRAAVEGSLQRLQTDTIDLYQLHRPQRYAQLRGKHDWDANQFNPQNNDEQNIIDTLQTLKKLVDAGIIRYIGLSNETSYGTMKFLQLARQMNLPVVQTIQNAYSLIRRDFEVNLAETCMYENVSLLAYSPLAGGILTGKYQNGAQPEGARYTTRGKTRMPQYVQQRVFDATDKYIAIANDLGITVTQLALARVNDRPFVGSNIIGATSLDQLKECISSADITLDQETLDRIDAVHGEFFNPACF